MLKIAYCHLMLAAVVTNLVCLDKPVFSQTTGGQLKAAVNTGEEDEFAFIITGMKTEMYKIVSGICRFKGTYSAEYEESPEQNLEGPIEGFLAIDNGKTRYDMTRPGWVIDQSSVESIKERPGSATAKTVKGTVATMYADDTVNTSFFNTENFAIVVSPSKDFPNPQVANYNDIRGITLYTSFSMTKRQTLEQVFDDLMHGSTLQGKVADFGNSTYVLTWSRTFGKAPNIQNVRWTLVVDAASGFTPKSYKCECASEKTLDEPWTLASENKTDWQRINGVWVPSHHEMARFSSPFSRLNERTTFDFYWESVNEPVNKDLFNYTTFKVADGVGVQDGSKWIREPKGREVGTEMDRGTSHLWLWVNVIVFVVLVAILVNRRARKGRAR